MKKALIITVGSVGLLLGSCCAFKYFTGDCPLMCLKKKMGGETTATAKPSN